MRKICINYEKHCEKIQIKVAPAFLQNGYRVLVNRQLKGISSWISDDGETDKVFDTIELANEAVINYAKKMLLSKVIDKFEVGYCD